MPLNLGKNKDERKTIVAIASNSSLCGGFNANAIAKVRAIRRPGDTVYAIGRKMADAMRKEGFASPEDFSALSEHPSYGPAAALVEKLVADVEAGRTGAVVLVYNHFVSTARQEPVVEVLMQRETPDQVGGDRGSGRKGLFSRSFLHSPAAGTLPGRTPGGARAQDPQTKTIRCAPGQRGR